MGVTYRLSISEMIEREGYEVRRSPAGALIVRGKDVAAWVSWTTFRQQFIKGKNL